MVKLIPNPTSHQPAAEVPLVRRQVLFQMQYSVHRPRFHFMLHECNVLAVYPPTPDHKAQHVPEVIFPTAFYR